MKNIYQIFQDMLKIDDFIVLERKNENYFLYPSKDSSFIINQDQYFIPDSKINITPLYSDFIKFITTLTNSLNKLLFLQKTIEVMLLDLEEKPIIDEMIQSELVEEIPIINEAIEIESVDSETKSQQNEITNEQFLNKNSQFRISNKLENIINNYHTLTFQLCFENGDFFFKFENPSQITYTQLKNFEFDMLPLQIQSQFNLHENYVDSFELSQFDKVQQLLQKQKIILSAKHVEVNLDLQQSVNTSIYVRGDEFEEAEGYYEMPNLLTNYFYLNITCSKSYGGIINLKIHLTPNFIIDNYRGKIIIMNKTEEYVIDDQPMLYGYSGYREGEIYDIFEIPSIIEKAQCFVYGKQLQNQSELDELFLEDQILLTILVLQKNSNSYQLQNSISQIVTDLFY
ncbi:hypothetical protein TTHERM_00028800 (macronuclear) [Tetrahymena thermophila SB210]|uniref:Uncharacterized protein n=1 Tax=Tetrahymena thermophila (strain SB210) TaxID=312017 RepID=Q22MZ4_TETTS|nr:hypothetical protein TTHERM_00028800 [Tetrahymena thermophila SB210]EAR86665.2 hypothetical protein TTHERM_00028800 [Tetrahymena thermophila SB210]|eukprot:XP_976876.2 hypothetical protein TTHERM_00028800 [Tetrahymena thermophila SB210]